MAKELYVYDNIVTLELPGVEVEPVVWHFDLVSIHDLLLKDPVSVAQAVSPGWVVQGGHRVEEAGGETSETAVSERSIVLLGDDVFHAEAEVAQTLLVNVSSVNGL